MTEPVLRMWTIYHGALDVSSPYCVREWKVGQGTVEAAGPPIEARTLEEARDVVPPGMICLNRKSHDDPVIVESWI